ncbi:MAG: endonuclease III [Luteitalea sp.]|nr:endonuclease III [Luteitalea sp.]
MPRLASGQPPSARQVVARLTKLYPDADTELHYSTPFQLLVATILSAQSTDRRVNEVTPALFARYPDARALARVKPETLEPLIRATGFFRAKSRTIVAMAGAVVERHHADVPSRMEELVELPGVGRKTANVVLGHAFKTPYGLAVDRHVLRVAPRIGLATGTTAESVEQELMAGAPRKDWTRLSDLLILHGRRICRPRPLCSDCTLNDICLFARGERAAGAPPRRTAAPATSPRPRP